MVSFQCEGTIMPVDNIPSDVVKKPKLDNHRAQCHSAFTCLDCSTTFHGPAEYKPHTSCVSEAKKYQGALYKDKGPKGKPYGQQSGRAQQAQEQAPAAGKYQSWSRNANGSGGGGSQQYQPGGRGFYQSRYEATGANGTPLGTPIRMSPITISPASPADDTGKKEPINLNDVQKKIEANVNRKDKKRKADVNQEGAESQPSKKLKADAEESSSPPKNKGEKKAKKEQEKKEEKKEKKGKPSAEVIEMPQVSGAAETNERGEKKKSKKDKKSKEVQKVEAGDATMDVEPPTAAVGASSEAKEDSGTKKDGKKKKSRTAGGAVVEPEPVPDVPDAQADAVEGKKEKKKSKKSKVDDAAEVVSAETGTVQADTLASAEIKAEKKAKKDKKEKKEKHKKSKLEVVGDS